MASNIRRLGTQENSNKYLPVNWTKQTMKCYTATVRRERAQARGRVEWLACSKHLEKVWHPPFLVAAKLLMHLGCGSVVDY